MTENAALKNSGYGRDQVVRIINSVIDRVQQTDFASKDVLFRELQDLKQVIDDARKQIGSARPADIGGIHIPQATDELDAVVGATEEATGTIMDACEVIQAGMNAMDGATAAAIELQITRIFEACSFQDITGQRITKVVNTLKAIEDKVGRILKVLENKMPGIEERPPEIDAGGAPDSLLNGPQLPGNAISQNDIDRLLAEFDN